MTLAEERKKLREEYKNWTHMKKGSAGSLPRQPTEERKNEIREMLKEEINSIQRFKPIIEKLEEELVEEIRFKIEER